MKVVWLCHLINKELNDFFGTELLELAPWMTDFINMFRSNKDLEIHIVAPNYFNNRNEEFYLHGIYYHFYKYYSGLFSNSKYAVLESAIMRDSIAIKNSSLFIKKINPSLIHLFGSENLFYSKCIIPFISIFPVLLSIQGFISQSPKSNNFIKNYVRSIRIRNEKRINASIKYISVANKYLLNHLF